jgi:hypothetical protein
MAHPGWNTVLEDWALNIERGLEAPTVVLVDRLSEESILRFVQALKLTATKSGAPRALKESRRSFLVPVLRRNFFDAELVERVQATFPSYSVAEAKQASSLPTDEMKARFRDAREMFFRACLVPNVLRGIPFFVGPEFVSSLEVPGHTVEVSHRYLMNGIRVTNSSADLKLRLVRENIKTGFVRARLGYREGQLSRAIEVDIYERYAIFHLAMASEYNLIMTPTDWQKRANVELYAALRKVPWLDEPYRIVCEAPENRIKSKLESNGNSQQTAAEPLDICKEIFKEKGVFGY